MRASYELIVTGDSMVTMGPDRTVLENSWIAVTGDRIERDRRATGLCAALAMVTVRCGSGPPAAAC